VVVRAEGVAVISFRYHVVTIVAVFLALAIGLLGGGAFVQPALQDQLERQTLDQLRNNAELREQLDAVRAEVAAMNGFASSAMPYLARDRLVGSTAVIVAHEEVEDALVASAEEALAIAGADVVGSFSASSDLLSEDPETQAQLADIVGVFSAPPEELSAAAADALARRLRAAPDDGALPEDDVLNRLLSAGFLDASEEASLDEIGRSGQIVVVLAGGATEEPALVPDAFAVPLVDALVELGVPVAAGESFTTPVPYVGAVDGDGVVTVDDLDLTMGGAALVLGLDRLLATGEGGTYGLKDGADPLPPLA
jgi:Copper transport outer membrane protein, MctB